MTATTYLEEVFRVIRDEFHPNDVTGSMTVASLAFQVKHRVGDWSSAGFTQFKDVLAELERQGLLKTGSNSKKAFAVWLPDDPRRSTTELCGEPNSSKARVVFRPLRGPVWFAFVSESPAGRSFFTGRRAKFEVAPIILRHVGPPAVSRMGTTSPRPLTGNCCCFQHHVSVTLA